MKRRTSQYLLWSVIAAYTVLIYATLSVVSTVRKLLVERFGYGVFDSVYWIFGAIGVIALLAILKKQRGRMLIRSISILVVLTIVYGYSLSRMSYAVERIHFLQYGLLGSLLFLALRFQCTVGYASFAAVVVSMWIGLGDEALQWALSSRVGEFRDAITNLFSSSLGVFATFALVHAKERGRSTFSVRKSVLLLIPTVGVIALFLSMVHGFGHAIETRSVGRFYSSFSRQQLQEINKKQSPNSRIEHTYQQEAERHLYQREFYYLNRFKGADGSYYQRLDVSWFEHRILQTFYSRFLTEHGSQKVTDLLEPKRGEVIAKSPNTVMWPDSVRLHLDAIVGEPDYLYESRVKNTIIRSFDAEDMAFYSLLAIGFLLWLFFRIPRRAGTQTTTEGR